MENKSEANNVNIVPVIISYKYSKRITNKICKFDLQVGRVLNPMNEIEFMSHVTNGNKKAAFIINDILRIFKSQNKLFKANFIKIIIALVKIYYIINTVNAFT